MRTENLAIVFIDIAGYTQRTSSQTREENLALLRRFDDMVRPLVRAYQGRVVKTIGDGMRAIISRLTGAEEQAIIFSLRRGAAAS